MYVRIIRINYVHANTFSCSQTGRPPTKMGDVSSMLSHADAFEVLCLQAADEGRGEVLFGDSLARARKEARPFMVGEEFPSVYLEFPLVGEPFLDVTVLYGALSEGTRIDSPAAAGTDGLLDWFSGPASDNDDVSCGFELDTKHAELPAAAIHFQPRRCTDFVRPFCEAIGEPERADLYLDMVNRMPPDWPLSFFGLFRGRPGSPMRVCGYLGEHVTKACGDDSSCVAQVFDRVGFAAYDTRMLEQVSEAMRVAPGTVDFQFDVFPDGSLGTTFALDIQFEIKQPKVVRASFGEGPAGRVMRLLQTWGLADERWRLVPQASFARSLPMALKDGSLGKYAFTLMPQWVKVRWTDCELQPSKLYHLARTSVLELDGTK